jgi:hypothetical protein
MKNRQGTFHGAIKHSRQNLKAFLREKKDHGGMAAEFYWEIWLSKA